MADTTAPLEDFSRAKVGIIGGGIRGCLAAYLVLRELSGDTPATNTWSSSEKNLVRFGNVHEHAIMMFGYYGNCLNASELHVL